MSVSSPGFGSRCPGRALDMKGDWGARTAKSRSGGPNIPPLCVHQGAGRVLAESEPPPSPPLLLGGGGGGGGGRPRGQTRGGGAAAAAAAAGRGRLLCQLARVHAERQLSERAARSVGPVSQPVGQSASQSVFRIGGGSSAPHCDFVIFMSDDRTVMVLCHLYERRSNGHGSL